ncbi:SAF domain-containing protein [bacterium]|nr:SAF domain-containing protein [bacterium]
MPSGHKIALTEITSGEEIIKYGRVIGLVTQDIQRGEHVHMKRAYL